jgi:hypothetical protein
MALDPEDFERIRQVIVEPLIDALSGTIPASVHVGVREGMREAAPEFAREIAHAVGGALASLEDSLGSRIDQTNARLDQTNERIDRVRVEMNGRFDELLRNTGGHWRDHEIRLTRIETRLFPPDAGESDDEDPED